MSTQRALLATIGVKTAGAAAGSTNAAPALTNAAPAGRGPGGRGGGNPFASAAAACEVVLLDEVIPYIDANFRTLSAHHLRVCSAPVPKPISTK